MDTGENLMDGILSLWQQPSVLLFLTLAVYALALILRARTGYLLLNPVLISTVTLIAYLKILDIDYAVYHDAAQFIDFWLKPAVVALAVPLYQNRQKIFSQWLPVIVSQLAGSVTGIITGMYFAKWLGAEREVVLSLARRQIRDQPHCHRNHPHHRRHPRHHRRHRHRCRTGRADRRLYRA